MSKIYKQSSLSIVI